MSIQYHVISHTHWDREWYEPFERFRVRLVRLMDNLLALVEKEPDYVFHLDAQIAVLDDYLEIKPYQRDKLKKHIKAGRILVGPWYIQNDFFLTSGEATVRNLMMGMAKAVEFGRCEYVGYTPDQFGLPSQLPQILNGFDIKYVVFGRGRVCNEEQANKAEFNWKTPDGSQVLAIQMPNFYNNAQRFSEDPTKSIALLKKIRQELAPRSSTEHLLLMNGVDHLEAQENLLDILPQLNSMLPDGEKVIQDSLDNYCKTIKQELTSPALYQGEMRHGGDRFILQGTLSSRVYLKVLNVQAEKALAAKLEPLCAMLLMLGFENEYDKEFLDYLWKLLIINHPHDSICGCSCDNVHRHMEDRYMSFFELVNHLLPEKMKTITSHIRNDNCKKSDYHLTIFNTAPGPRQEVVRAQIDLKHDEHNRAFKIISPEGRDVAFEIIDRELTERAIRSPINLPGKILVDRYNILFKAEVPALGYTQYIVRPVEHEAAQSKAMDFENAYLKVSVLEDGKINIYDKLSDREYLNVLWLEDTADYGDSYTYRPNPNEPLFSTADLIPEIEYPANNLMETCCYLKFDLKLPADYNRKRQQRSKQTIFNRIEIKLRLAAESKHLEVGFKIENKSKDHCLKAVINTGIDSEYSYASSPFDVIRRDKYNGDIIKRSDMQEPTSDFVCIKNDNGGMAILHEGLHAYENIKERDGQIAMTLLRATGYIQGYFDLPLDKDWIAPENQCLRTVESRMAIMPLSAGESPESVASAATDYLNSMFCYSGSCDEEKFSGGRPCVQDSDISEIFFREDRYAKMALPVEASLFHYNNKNILLIACKKAQNSDNLVFRLLNTSILSETCIIDTGFKIKIANISNLQEEKIQRLKNVSDSQFEINFKPKQLITLVIEK
jgi:alpha-mannosidase